ncbi:Cytoplasmic phosphatidylinositol transfer protein 1 isoform X4 [Aix galericulata]|nr:Cytoplasmic phosphatidylinositol transfer protein 1 isoform X4 [Aix galericulata]
MPTSKGVAARAEALVRLPSKAAWPTQRAGGQLAARRRAQQQPPAPALPAGPGTRSCTASSRLQQLDAGMKLVRFKNQISEYRKYRIGQLYMISKHSHEQSDRGEGVEVVQNEPYEDPNHGNGQLTEKRVYLNRQCSFLPKFSIHIETKYEDNKGSNDSIFDNEAKDLEREVCFIDIASDEIPERYYKESEDPKYFKSQKTGRGQLKEGWRETHQPIMCSYKLVTVKFEVWGLQTRVEQFVHKVVRDILLIGHRQAFAWVDEWYDMTMDDVREYEKNMHEKTNIKVCNQHSSTVDEIESHAKART